MLSPIQGPNVRGEPQPGDNNQGKRPSFYDLGMGPASFKALFSFLHSHSHPSQDPKQIPAYGLPWQDFKVRNHHQPGVKREIVFLSPPTAPIQQLSMQGQKGLRQVGHRTSQNHTYNTVHTGQTGTCWSETAWAQAQGRGWCEEVVMAATEELSPSLIIVDGRL